MILYFSEMHVKHFWKSTSIFLIRQSVPRDKNSTFCFRQQQHDSWYNWLMSTNSTGVNNLLLWVWNQFSSEAPEATDPDGLLNLDRRQEEFFTSLPFNFLFSPPTSPLFPHLPSTLLKDRPWVGSPASDLKWLWKQVIGSHDPWINKCQSENKKKKTEGRACWFHYPHREL